MGLMPTRNVSRRCARPGVDEELLPGQIAVRPYSGISTATARFYIVYTTERDDCVVVVPHCSLSPLAEWSARGDSEAIIAFCILACGARALRDRFVSFGAAGARSR